MKKSKFIKQLAAALLIVTMLCAMTVSASAATTPHSYVTFQIFTGTQTSPDADPDGGVKPSEKLADIQWATQIDAVNFLAALKTEGLVPADAATAADVAKAFSAYGDDEPAARKIAKIAYKYKVGNGTPYNGYISSPGYYLVVDVTDFGEEETDTYYNLALLQVTQKGDFDIKTKVTVPSVIKEVKEDSTGKWQKGADFDIDDSVPFHLKATIGDISGFDTYFLEFNDKMADSLDFDEDTPITVLLNGAPITRGFTTSVNKTLHTFNVSFEDVLSLGVKKGDVIDVYYNAILNSKAACGKVGNLNYVYLTYSNNPNVQDSKGRTPDSKVMVYTWQVIINKVDENEKPLPGAQFELINKDTGKSYGIVEAAAVVDKISGKTVSYTAKWDGVDAGNYTLKEKKAPAGYNKLDDVDFTISSSFANASNVETMYIQSFTVTPEEFFTADTYYCYVTANIENKSGVILPETGGIGTTVFYALGTALLTLGVVLFITKKRVSED